MKYLGKIEDTNDVVDKSYVDDNITTAVDGIVIGGRNLLLSSGFDNMSNWHATTWYKDGTFMGGNVITCDATAISTYAYLKQTIAYPSKVNIGETYTISFWIKRDVYAGSGSPPGFTWYLTNITGHTSTTGPSLDNRWEPILSTTSWTKVSRTITFTAKQNDSAPIMWFRCGSGSKVSICMPQWERGTKATDWTPAPEDTQSAITTLTDQYNTVNDTLTSHIGSNGDSHAVVTTSKNGFMSTSDKTKLDGIATGANAYSLPTATSSVLGGVKVGTNLSISDGVLSATNTNTTYSAGTGLSLSGTTFNHSNSATAGTYRSVTIDSQGHVTAGTNPTTLSLVATSADNALNITNQYDNSGISVINSSDGNGIYVQNTSTTGKGIRVDSGSSTGVIVTGGESSSVTTGAIVVDGGIGCSGTIFSNSIKSSAISATSSLVTPEINGYHGTLAINNPGSLTLSSTNTTLSSSSLMSITCNSYKLLSCNTGNSYATFFGDSSTVTVLQGSSVRLKSTTGTVVTSDENKKHDIKPLDQRYISMIDDIKPVTFIYNEDKKNRINTGFTAQQIKSVMDKCGISDGEFSGYYNEDGELGLIYDSFIPMLVAKVQRQSEDIKDLQNKIERIEKILSSEQSK